MDVGVDEMGLRLTVKDRRYISFLGELADRFGGLEWQCPMLRMDHGNGLERQHKVQYVSITYA